MTLRVATIGAGFFSQFHRGSWARIDSVELIAVADQDIELARSTGFPAYTSLDDVLADTTLDILDIILPPAAHAATIRTALAAGIRNIICQKPFCTSLEEARTITSEAKAAGSTLIIHENFRFQPWYRTIHTAIKDGKLGEVQQMTFRLRPGDGQGPRAYLDRQPYFQQMERFLVHETAVHWIDTFRYLFGNPLAVYADLRQINPVISGEDAGVILFDHPQGVCTIFDGNRHLDHAADNHRRTMGEALVEGTAGTLTLAGDGSVRHRAFSDINEIELLSPDTHDGFGGDCVHAFQLHAINGFQNGGTLETKVEDYLTVIEIEEAIYRSADTSSKVALLT
ncbi:MAG: Gfo/Idh/MocA family oxidoreductase [Silicimonas sp.]|nr:Gfo/Idh/MocA family oxidoreductase [Silicimonas sp.]